MIAYIESNFILEIALGQEQVSDAEAILQFAEHQAVELVCPAFSLSEPFATLAKRGVDRRRLSRSLNDTLRDLARSASHQERVQAMKPTSDLLLNVAKQELDGLQSTIARLLLAGRTIPLTSSVFIAAQTYQTSYGLSPQDSIIYASVISDLPLHPTKPKCLSVGIGMISRSQGFWLN